MCGFLSIVVKEDLSSEKISKVIEGSLEKSKHRGPDFQDWVLITPEGTTYSSLEELEVVSKGSVIFVHSRLSILDVSSSGSQPFTKNNRDFLVYNGEIYNYLELSSEYNLDEEGLISSSDTEVVYDLISTHGLGVVNNFNGDWSFVYYDGIRRELSISRDRFGIKPLYYYADSQILLVGSEIKMFFGWARPPLIGARRN